MSLPSFLCSRRHFLHGGSFGLGGLALASLLRDDGLLAAPVKPLLSGDSFDLKPKTPPAPAKARAMISLFMMGGPSQMDLFDPKPILNKLHGEKFPGEVKYDNVAQASAKVFGCPWNFVKSGQSGMELSELLPNLQQVADDITLIRSMKSGVSNHLQGMLAMLTGRGTVGRPTLGSWVAYALGSETRDLPAFVVLAHPSGLPTFQHQHWSNGWLPSLYQGTLVQAKSPYILNLDAPAALAGRAQDRQMALLRSLNDAHAAEHPGEHDLRARIASYELAGRMQFAAKEALDISGEPKHILALYGVDNPITADYGRRCLIARRLVERGVRYVQVLNNGQSWDHHGSLIKNLPERCAETDRGSAALVFDLKQRGLLDSTVVHWGGEMGRLPVLQNDAGRDKWGRDHNTHGFSQWVAGGGFKRGCVYGETDEFGHHAIKDVVNHYDWHATLLQNFGFDHEKLGFLRNGANMTLTDAQGAKVVDGILA
jgi:hypothetical protein